jgi:predicted  nucleic acid-binding Zn-ribbon protein
LAVNFSEQIKLLVELQGLDTQIFRLEDELEAIPVAIKDAEDRFNAKSAGLKSLEEGVKALQLKRKAREGDLQAKEDAIKKFQSQMYQVKTNKEYTAFQEEINRTKADGSLIEEDIIKIFDQVDAENRKIAVEKESLKKEEASLAAEKKKLEADGVRIKAELETLRAQRTAMAAKVDPTVLPKYERIVRSKDGLAVVPVSGESCQGCFRVMPPQVINEIRMKSDLIVCENCARILYIEE